MPQYDRSTALIGDVLITKAENTISHCGVVVGNTEAKAPKLQVFHATGAGMKLDDVGLWSAKADVFRPRGLDSDAFRKQMTIVAEKMQKAGTEYGLARVLAMSWSGTSAFGNGARERLAKYRDRLKANQQVVKHVYCSEAVILVFQLASEKETDRHFIKLDAKHSFPKTLREYLKENATYWEKSALEAGG